MKKKTPNAQRRADEGQWIPDRRVREDALVYAALEKADSISNAQRSTLNEPQELIKIFFSSIRTAEKNAR
jgi:hypothetical protein